MSKNLKNNQEFGTHLISVFHELRDANDHFHFVNCLHQAVSDYEREINCAPTFWIYTINAHVAATMSRLYRVYDYDPAAVHLLFLVESVRNNPDVFCREAFEQRLAKGPGWDDLVKQFGEPDSVQIEADIQFCSACGADPLVQRLRKWRHNVGAHLNKGVSINFDAFKQQWPLERSDIHGLITRAHEILNRCSGWFNAVSLSRNLPSPCDKDYKFVLESMRVNLSKRDVHDTLLEQLISKSPAAPAQLL